MMLKRPTLYAIKVTAFVALTIGATSEAFAQQPSQAQVNAIRQACRSDYMAHCSSVPTGGAAALQCLQQHASSMSGGCQQALNAIKSAAPAKAKAAPTPAPAAVPATPAKAPAMQSKKAQLASIRRACGNDYRVHCHGIPPGGQAALACLKRNAMTLSPACQHVLSAAAAARPAAAAPAAAAAPVPAAAPPVAPVAAPAVVVAPPVEPAPLLVSPREEMFILRTSCRGDYMRFCQGLRFGAGRVAACMHYKAANMSHRC